MPSFNCDGCGDVIKKPKLDAHSMRCKASVTCLDCSTTFANQAGWKSHTSCISEAQKYEKSLYKPPKPKKKHQDKEIPAEPSLPSIAAIPVSVPGTTKPDLSKPTKSTGSQKENVASIDLSLDKSLTKTPPSAPLTTTTDPSAKSTAKDDTNEPSCATSSEKKKKKNKKNKNKELNPTQGPVVEQTPNSTAPALAPTAASQTKTAAASAVAGEAVKPKAAAVPSVAGEEAKPKAAAVPSVAGEELKLKAAPLPSVAGEELKLKAAPVPSVAGEKAESKAAPAGQKDTPAAQPTPKKDTSSKPTASADSPASKLPVDAPGAAAEQGPEKKKEKKRKREAQAATDETEGLPKDSKLRRKIARALSARADAPALAGPVNVVAVPDGTPKNVAHVSAEQVSKAAQGLVRAAAGQPLTIHQLAGCVASYLQKQTGPGLIVRQPDVLRILVGGAVKLVASSGSGSGHGDEDATIGLEWVTTSETS